MALPGCTLSSRRRRGFLLEGEGMEKDMACRQMSTIVNVSWPLNGGAHCAPSARNPRPPKTCKEVVIQSEHSPELLVDLRKYKEGVMRKSIFGKGEWPVAPQCSGAPFLGTAHCSFQLHSGWPGLVTVEIGRGGGVWIAYRGLELIANPALGLKHCSLKRTDSTPAPILSCFSFPGF